MKHILRLGLATVGRAYVLQICLARVLSPCVGQEIVLELNLERSGFGLM